jgi:hypothetical protein
LGFEVMYVDDLVVGVVSAVIALRRGKGGK